MRVQNHPKSAFTPSSPRRWGRATGIVAIIRARRLLERLEAAWGGPNEAPPHVLLYLKHVDNARREMDALEPVPLSPEEEALDKDDPEWDEWWEDYRTAWDSRDSEALRDVNERWHRMRRGRVCGFSGPAPQARGRRQA